MNTNKITSVAVSPEALELLMDVAELANYLGIPVSTVYDWHLHGKGPDGNDEKSLEAA
ncbi:MULTISPECIES: helix-turn-helix domain-containing protein [unclassified Cryobacterium]|uniref:helix-turn-helix domain-containing protein n=1 Tax=unclassified Cryobacterium TaxID=2649013 RepID=UPI001304E0A1|nr:MULTISPECIES: helix-turn-helix domain-containing protein [unclassified Cryobacterium]